MVSLKNDIGGVQRPYELNINYFDALNDPDAGEPLDVQVDRFVTAHAILLAMRGVPAIYFHSLVGSRGWPEHAPFDKVIVTAAALDCPPPLLDQLKPGGRMVLPLGVPDAQRLTVVDKDKGGTCRFHQHIPVRFSELETVR